MSSLNAKIKDAFHELASERSGSKGPKARRRNCARPMAPGTAVGGCAFDGAKVALQPITDVAHLIHGPLACEEIPGTTVALPRQVQRFGARASRLILRKSTS